MITRNRHDWAGSRLGRRAFLKAGAAAGATLGMPQVFGSAFAQGTSPLSMQAWSAAVDLVRSHLTAFEESTGIRVDYGNAPWAQYRETMVTRFIGGAPIDMLWVSDAWLPEWADAGWIAPIDQYDFLTAYNADAAPIATESMIHNGEQYGLTYYTDYMGFLYNEEMLAEAGFTAPPTSWDEVVEQSLVLKERGIAEYPMLLSMAQESWLIEFMSALVFSHGGRFTDDDGDAIMHDEREGAVSALQWIVDGVRTHQIISPACVETGELAALTALSAGNHAFAILPKYRLRVLNDPAQSAVAGKIKQALMPMGADGSHTTVGWMRFHGMSAQAAQNPERADQTARLIEWFGGKADGEYTFQKLLFLDAGTDFAVTPLFDDPEVQQAYGQFADLAIVREQLALSRKKDVITSWYGEWTETNGSAWQSAILGNTTPQAALSESAEIWNRLKARG